MDMGKVLRSSKSDMAAKKSNMRKREFGKC